MQFDKKEKGLETLKHREGKYKERDSWCFAFCTL